MIEAERLYLLIAEFVMEPTSTEMVHCTKMGTGPIRAAPKNLVADAGCAGNAQMDKCFTLFSYGKGQMGSYASQLSTTQRWMVIHYINSKQSPAKAETTGSESRYNSGKITERSITITNL
jgi:hypothetical protein